MTNNNETPAGVLDESARIAEQAAQEPGIPEIVRLMELADASFGQGSASFHEDVAVELNATTHTSTLYRI